MNVNRSKTTTPTATGFLSNPTQTSNFNSNDNNIKLHQRQQQCQSNSRILNNITQARYWDIQTNTYTTLTICLFDCLSSQSWLAWVKIARTYNTSFARKAYAIGSLPLQFSICVYWSIGVFEFVYSWVCASVSVSVRVSRIGSAHMISLLFFLSLLLLSLLPVGMFCFACKRLRFTSPIV